MIRRFVVAATFLGIAACVTSAPESPESTAKAGKSVTNSNSTAAVNELQFGDVPEVPETPILARNEKPNGLVCRYERETGTHMRTRVCRWRADIEETRLATQQELREMSLGTGATFRPPYD